MQQQERKYTIPEQVCCYYPECKRGFWCYYLPKDLRDELLALRIIQKWQELSVDGEIQYIPGENSTKLFGMGGIPYQDATMTGETNIPEKNHAEVSVVVCNQCAPKGIPTTFTPTRCDLCGNSVHNGNSTVFTTDDLIPRYEYPFDIREYEYPFDKKKINLITCSACSENKS